MHDLFARLRSAGTVTVNGKTYTGSNVSIINGVVTVDGQRVDDAQSSPKIEVSIQGDVESLETASGKVSVTGSVGSIKTASGDVRCGAVQGNVASMSGDIVCAAIAGNASSMSGDVGR